MCYYYKQKTSTNPSQAQGISFMLSLQCTLLCTKVGLGQQLYTLQKAVLNDMHPGYIKVFHSHMAFIITLNDLQK